MCALYSPSPTSSSVQLLIFEEMQLHPEGNHPFHSTDDTYPHGSLQNVTGQCSDHVTWGRVRATIVAVEKQ